MTLETTQLKSIIEGALLAYGQPLTLEKITELFEEEERPSKQVLRDVLSEMADDYAEHAFELKQLASGYCFRVRQEHAPYIAKLWQEKPARYSRALLETMAIIAYRQPVTRADIEDIRGVAVSTHIIRTLEEREWVKVIGHRDVPGKPAIFGTTKAFLDYFNLKSLEELPSLQEIKDLDQLAGKLDPQLKLDVDAEQTDQAEQAEQAPSDDITAEVDEETDNTDIEVPALAISSEDETHAEADAALEPVATEQTAQDATTDIETPMKEEPDLETLE